MQNDCDLDLGEIKALQEYRDFRNTQKQQHQSADLRIPLGHCGKCGAPYYNGTALGDAYPRLAPSCKCWNLKGGQNAS